MRDYFDSYVMRVLLAPPAPARSVAPVAWHWRRMTAPLSDPYQPGAHYMRGPGPKWRTRHTRATPH